MYYLDIFNVLLALLCLSHITNKLFIISLRIFHSIGHHNQVWELISSNLQDIQNLG
jgi:hypothetical protein